MASDKDRPEQGHDLLQAAYNGLTGVIDDIRHKVVEEPWFNYENGRAITGDTPKRSEFYDTPSWARGADAWANAQDSNLSTTQTDDRHEQAQDNTRDYEIER